MSLKKNYTNFNNLNISLRYKITSKHRKSNHLNKQPCLKIKKKKKEKNFLIHFIKDESHTIKKIIFIIRRIKRPC